MNIPSWLCEYISMIGAYTFCLSNTTLSLSKALASMEIVFSCNTILPVIVSVSTCLDNKDWYVQELYQNLEYQYNSKPWSSSSLSNTTH